MKKSLLDKYLKEVNAQSDRWCILCEKPFRISMKLDSQLERYNTCPDCYIYNNQ